MMRIAIIPSKLFLIFLIIIFARGESEPIYLLSYAESENSISDPLEDQSLTIAAELAVETINNKTDLLPGYTLQLVSGKSGCIVFDYVSLFQDLLYSSKRIVGIVGPGCSESSFAVGYQIVQSNLSMISIGLANYNQEKMALKNSFSLLDGTDFSRALLKIIEKRGWTRIFVVYDLTSDYYLLIFEHFLNHLPNHVRKNLVYQPLHNSTLDFAPGGQPEINCALNPQVTIIIARSNVASILLCYFYSIRVSNPNHQFIIVGHIMDDVVKDVDFSMKNTDDLICSSDVIKHQLNKAIFLQYKLNIRSSITTSGLSYSDFIDQYHRRIESHKQNVANPASTGTLKPSYFGAFYFDAIWTQILALDLTAKKINLSFYHFGSKNITSMIRTNLLSLDFYGISGRVKFNTTTGFVEHDVDIYQVRNSSMQSLEYYNSLHKEIYLYGNESVDYIDDKLTMTTNKEILGIALLILIAFLAFILMGLQVVTIMYREHSSIKASSPRVLHLSYIGCYAVLVGCALKTVSYCFQMGFLTVDNHCIVEYSADFFVGTGSILIFATLACISFRIYRIFVHYMNPGRFIGDKYLIAFILIITVLYMTVNIVTTSSCLPDASLACIKVTEREMYIKTVCNYSKVWYVRLPILAFPVLLIIIACVFSLLSNGRISIKKFKTTSVLILCYLFFLDVMVWTMYLLLQRQETPEFELIISTTIVLASVCVSLLYLPPTLPIFKEWFAYKGHCATDLLHLHLESAPLK